MKSSRRYVSILAVLFAISISLAIVGGCTSNAVAPENGNQNQTKLDWLNQSFNDGGASRGPALNDCPVVYDTTLTQVVNSKGSTFMLVTGDEKIAFKLPKDAVSQTVTLTVRVTKYQASFGFFWLLDCGPEGTKFAKPLQVTPNNGTSKSSVNVLFYYNPNSRLWEVQQTATFGNNQQTGNNTGNSDNSSLMIYHFSMYGIS